MFEMQKEKLTKVNKERNEILEEVTMFLNNTLAEALDMFEVLDCDGQEVTEIEFKCEDGKIWFDYSVAY